MTPEEDIKSIVTGICPDSDHWPMTKNSGLFVGFRPSGEKLMLAGDRIVRTVITYDLTIFAQRGAQAAKMEKMRYSLYQALMQGGWQLEGNPGPESYIPEHNLFAWPLACTKSFVLINGTPQDPRTLDGGIR